MRRPGRLTTPPCLFLLTFAVVMTAGCSSALRGLSGLPIFHSSGAGEKDLTIQSRANPQTLTVGGFDHGIYTQTDPSTITVLLTDGPVDQPKRALIVRMFWRPVATATPLDETATNATVQYIVFDRGSEAAAKPIVGIYSGGGFLFPNSDLGEPTLTASLWQATLNLADASPGFEDDLGASLLKGRFTARRDDDAMPEALRQVNIAVSEALGSPRFVRAD